ncbi:MAG TPA: mechanosensitive ion channel family protein [Candidatus Krumholzibacteria bacterium]|nr:mechanosensitive ion channel family protein [Candidatus Krumholzibacteria bacterium]
MNDSYRVLMAAHRQNLEEPGIFSSRTVRQRADVAERLFERAASCLDLSEIPMSFRREIAYQAALTLKEILDRIDLPQDRLTPDTNIAGGSEPTVDHWRVPDTDIVIARVQSGPREGSYLFSPRTVVQLGHFYQEVKGLPYKPGASTTPGFLTFYVTTPGSLMPPKWDRWLPAWSRRVWFSLTIWQWVALAATLCSLFFIVLVAFRRLVPAAGLSPAMRAWRRALFCLVALLAILGSHFIMRTQINVTGSAFVFLRMVLQPVWWLLGGAMTFSLATALAETIVDSPKIDPEGIQASYFRVLFGVLGFVGGVTVLSIGLARIGVSIVPLLTGLGIGGLAVALAARPTLENIISSFTIFADNPYRVGDRIYVMGQLGKVESIGIRSTKVRLLNGNLTTVPNERMASTEVENLGRRPYIRRVFDISVTYGTPPEKIRRAIDILREILAVPEGSDPDHPNTGINQPDFPPRVHFDEFKADSLNIKVHYWFHPPDYWKYLEHANWVNLQIKERFNGEEIDFAFPTQTVHLATAERGSQSGVQERHSTEGAT